MSGDGPSPSETNGLSSKRHFTAALCREILRARILLPSSTVLRAAPDRNNAGVALEQRGSPL